MICDNLHLCSVQKCTECNLKLLCAVAAATIGKLDTLPYYNYTLAIFYRKLVDVLQLKRTDEVVIVKKGINIVSYEYNLIFVKKSISLQDNSIDCGALVCLVSYHYQYVMLALIPY